MATNTIWDFITVGNGPAASAAVAPYVANGGENYYELYCNSDKCEHALKHCFEMARWRYRNEQLPQGCDWLVAASAHGHAEAEFLPQILNVWNELGNCEGASWPELLRKPPLQLGARLVGITLIRVLATTSATFSREANARLLAYIREALPDVCIHLGIEKDLTDYEQVALTKKLGPRLVEVLQPVIESSQVPDLDSVLLRRHLIGQALNHKLVMAVLSPHLPPAFARSTVQAVLKSVEDLVSSPDARFLEVVSRTRNEIAAAVAKLADCATFYALTFLLPFCEHLMSLLEMRLESSDAAKPASLTVEPYPRKYPFHAVGRTCRLRFDVHNAGPGPATEIELAFIFWADVDPIEVQRTIPELECGRCMIDIDVQIQDIITEPVEYEVTCSWCNYDGGRVTRESQGTLGIQPPIDLCLANEPSQRTNLACAKKDRRMVWS